MQKVTVKQQFRSEGKVFRVGDIVEFEDKRADYFHRMGRVELGKVAISKTKSASKEKPCSPCQKAKEDKSTPETKELKDPVATK